MKRSPLVVALVVLGGWGILAIKFSDFWNLDNPIGTSLSEKAVSPSHNFDLRPTAQSMISAEKTKAINNEDAKNSLSILLRRSDDFRTFAITAQQNPASGGRFLAAWAARQCAIAPDYVRGIFSEQRAAEVLTSATVSLERIKARDVLQRQCASFTKEEADNLLLSLKAQASDGIDPVQRASYSLTKAYFDSNSDEFKSAFGELLGSGVLLALDNNQLSLIDMIGANARNRRGERWFDGENLTSTRGTFGEIEYALAFKLATCGAPGVCGVDQEMIMLCAVEGRCASDREDFIRMQTQASGGSKQDLERIKQLSTRMQAAITAGDIRPFLAPS